MSEWGGTHDEFLEEVEYNKLLRDRNAIHDCAGAGCETDPFNVNILLPNDNPNPAANPGRRPPPSARETALHNKHIRPRR